MEASAPRFDELRGRFGQQIEGARDAGSEDALVDVLYSIIDEARKALGRIGGRAEENPSDFADDVVAAAQAWASVASYAVTRFYFEGPKSIFKLGGFSKAITKALHTLARTLSRPLQASLGVLGASAVSVAVGFPFGVSVSLTWDLEDPHRALARAIEVARRGAEGAESNSAFETRMTKAEAEFRKGIEESDPIEL